MPACFSRVDLYLLNIILLAKQSRIYPWYSVGNQVQTEDQWLSGYQLFLLQWNLFQVHYGWKSILIDWLLISFLL